MPNKKQTSEQVASLAAKTLSDPSSSGIQRSLAASALRQTGTHSQTGKEMESKASRALNNPHSAKTTKILAASLVSQSNKKR